MAFQTATIMVGFSNFWHFASDAELAAAGGAVLLVLAAAALVAERRRSKRRMRDDIGWMPWTGIFLACAMAGTALLALALPVVVQGR